MLMKSILELNDYELETIDGGWNVLEYLPMGLGWLNGRAEGGGKYTYPGHAPYESALKV